jgi:hypothetical protein
LILTAASAAVSRERDKAMTDRKEELRAEIRRLDERIEEQKQRIPPHSAKPEHIQELERLEEEREALQEELSSL